MSSVIIIAPLVIAAWPSITVAVTAAVATMGFTVTSNKTRARVSTTTRAEIEVENSEILEAAGATGDQMVVERQGVRAIFSRDGRGALKVCVEGEGHSKAELHQIGQDLIERVTQQFVYNRVVTELKDRHMAIVDEEVSEDKTIRIRVRNL